MGTELRNPFLDVAACDVLMDDQYLSRATRKLMNRGVETIEELIEHSEEDLHANFGFTVDVVERIKEALKPTNLHLSR